MGGATAKDYALLFRQFASLAKAGISLHEATSNLAARTAQPSLAHSLRAMEASTRAGGRISDVMERYPRLYAPHVVSAVRAGETGGFVEIVLDEVAVDAELELAFYKGIWLPRALVIQELLALAIVQPLFPTLFPNAQFGAYLQLVLLRNLPIALLLLLGVRHFARWMREPAQRDRRDAWTLRMPVFGDLARQRSLAAFVRMLRRLYAAGLSPAAAWEGAMNVAPNTQIRARLVEAGTAVRAGVPIHDAFANTGLFAGETEQLLATGVVSGQVVEMLDRVGAYYQANVDRASTSARFWMWRLGICLFIALTGAVLLVMVHTYFQAVFNFTKDWLD